MLSRDEETLISNVVNELVFGLPSTVHTKPVHTRQAELRQLQEEWEQAPGLATALRHQDLLADSIRAVIAELGPGEFETRIGVDIHEAETVLLRLSNSGFGA